MLATLKAVQQCMYHMTLCARILSPPPSARGVPTSDEHVLIVRHFKQAKLRRPHQKGSCPLLGWACFGPMDESSVANKRTGFFCVCVCVFFRVAKSTSHFVFSLHVVDLST
jgi:hypothetical protein